MSTVLIKIPSRREEDDTEERELHEGGANGAANHFHNNLELRLGMSLDNGLEVGKVKGGGAGVAPCPELVRTQDAHLIPRNGRAKRSFCETSRDFVHPWSLAARQEKAALEQADQKPTSIVSRTTNSSVPVGWPPLCSFRKNLSGLQHPKIAVELEKKTEKTRTLEENNMPNNVQGRSVMFVKVNLEGCAVGRKINLKAHDGYDSLSHALQKMFHNFSSANYIKNRTRDSEAMSPNYILLYEDAEGDRMLVGDVPWEMFISAAKRLYITEEHGPTWLTISERT